MPKSGVGDIITTKLRHTFKLDFLAIPCLFQRTPSFHFVCFRVITFLYHIVLICKHHSRPQHITWNGIRDNHFFYLIRILFHHFSGFCSLFRIGHFLIGQIQFRIAFHIKSFQCTGINTAFKTIGGFHSNRVGIRHVFTVVIIDNLWITF